MLLLIILQLMILGTIFDERSKRAQLTTNKDFGTVKEHDIEKKERTEKLQTFDFSYFLRINYFGNDGFQNICVYVQNIYNCTKYIF